MNVHRIIASFALAGMLVLPTLGMGQGRPNANRPDPKHSNDLKKNDDRRNHDRQDNDRRDNERRDRERRDNERRENERRDNERRDRDRRDNERRENERRENERRNNQRWDDNRRNNDRWDDNRRGNDRWDDNRQDSKNEWRNIGIGAGLLGLLGILEHDSTLTFAGTAGTLYSAYRYEEDRKSQNQHDRARAVYFGHTSFTRNGHRYERRTVNQRGQKYYQFVRCD